MAVKIKILGHEHHAQRRYLRAFERFLHHEDPFKEYETSCGEEAIELISERKVVT